MSEATTRAYAASAEALTQNLLAYGSDLLGLDPQTERLVPHATEPYRVELVTGIGAPFPLTTVSLKQWRRRGPGSTTEVMIRGLGHLARTRVWRRRGTIAPPYGLLHTSALAKAVVERAKVAPQDFFDATWADVAIGEKYSDSADWMSADPPPALLARAAVATHPAIDLPARLPWLSGYSTLDAVFIDALMLDERVVVHHRPQDGDRFEIRLRPDLPMVLATAVAGRPLSGVISHPVLDRFAITIIGVTTHQRSIRLLVTGTEPWTRRQFAGGSDARREVNQEIKSLKSGRRLLEDLIARHLTIPGHKGDIQLPIDADVVFDDDWDEFADRPWPRCEEFEGIYTKRRARDARHDEGDPAIVFDEDDPASYT